MIVVTGSKRSGTSMWMQVLAAAGFPVIGSAFLGRWEESIAAANPRGYFESRLRRGVYYATNPDPDTGAFLAPGATREHVVKVFVPGLVRSDMAYLHRVLATLRDWRAYGPSLARLHALEDRWLDGRALLPGETEAQRAERAQRARTARGTLPPPIEWWTETYELVRDVATRRYAFHLCTYERLLADPEAEIGKVLRWIGKGDLAAAVAAVAPPDRAPTRDDGGLDAETAAFFDEVYAALHRHSALDRALLERMNVQHQRIRERYRGARRDVDAEGPA